MAEDLKSLISRKLSMEVSINRITQLSSSGELGISFTRDGYCGQLQLKERVQVQAALDLFYEIRDEMESDWLRSSRLSVLEEDNYILCNQKVFHYLLSRELSTSFFGMCRFEFTVTCTYLLTLVVDVYRVKW